jgi:hypothetical protein
MVVKFNKGKGNFKEAKDKIKEILKSLNNSIFPESCFSVPKIIFERVDFPEPLAPIKATFSPK